MTDPQQTLYAQAHAALDLAEAAHDLFAALDALATWTHALAVHGTAPPAAWALLDKLHAQADAALNKAQGIEP